MSKKKGNKNKKELLALITLILNLLIAIVNLIKEILK